MFIYRRWAPQKSVVELLGESDVFEQLAILVTFDGGGIVLRLYSCARVAVLLTTQKEWTLLLLQRLVETHTELVRLQRGLRHAHRLDLSLIR